MKKNVRADLKPFYCKISFNVECAKSDFDALLDHYKSLCSFYNIEGTFFHRQLEDGSQGCEYYSFALSLSKSKENYHLSTVALRNVFLYDLEIIRQLDYINDLEFECPAVA